MEKTYRTRFQKWISPAAALFVAINTMAWPASALDALEEKTYHLAFKAAAIGQWDTVVRERPKNQENLATQVLDWILLTDEKTEPSFNQIKDFIDRHPAWPRQAVLLKKAEKALPVNVAAQEVVAWFGVYPPQTPVGATRYINALLSLDQREKAADIASDFWVRGTFGSVEEKDFLKAFDDFIALSAHRDRLERLLWLNQTAPAERLLGKVDAVSKDVARVRIRFQRRTSDAEKSMFSLSPDQQKNPGILYDYVEWLRRQKRDEFAADLILKAPTDMPYPEIWWPERQIIARRLIEKGDYRRAYKVIKAHGQKEGLGVAEAEFLAGWLALRRNQEPQAAFHHFQTLYDHVSTPISLARGAYWTARALEELPNKKQDAREWYQKASAHKTTFYGQLAALRLNPKAELSLPDSVPLSEEQKKDFRDNEFVQAIQLLDRIEKAVGASSPLWSDVFLRHLGRPDVSAPELAMGAKLAHDMGRTDIAIALSKLASAQGFYQVDISYPLLPANQRSDKANTALVHALIRQESTFNQRAVSSVGARGLMQLMPATARQVAKSLKLNHNQSRLTQDAAYNVRLGSTYLSRMMDQFEGSYILAVAAYNAGPGRSKSWRESQGNPHRSVDVAIDWIEQIPFDETRNYVMRVLEGSQVYQSRLANGTAPLTLEKILANTPH